MLLLANSIGFGQVFSLSLTVVVSIPEYPAFLLEPTRTL